MRTISSHLIHILLLGYLLFSATDTAQACTSIPTTPRHIVQNAEIIVRATPVETVENQGVKLKVTEVLKGTNVPITLIIYLMCKSLVQNQTIKVKRFSFELQVEKDGDCMCQNFSN